MPVGHYENFPVASLLLPKKLRPAVEAIYTFARTADDLADEGNAQPDERIASLAQFETELDRIAAGNPSPHPIFHKLSQVIASHCLPFEPFYHLLSAFRQDVVVTRYDNFAMVLDYCARSANPVGRLMLALYGVSGTHQIAQSDSICSALQLINFLQDVEIDWRKDRIYLPLDDMQLFGVTPHHLIEQRVDAAWCNLMKFEVARARALLLSGGPLALQLPGRIGWELRLVVQGGLRILDRIEVGNYDVFKSRPKLVAADWCCMAWRAVFMHRH